MDINKKDTIKVLLDKIEKLNNEFRNTKYVDSSGWSDDTFLEFTAKMLKVIHIQEKTMRWFKK